MKNKVEGGIKESKIGIQPLQIMLETLKLGVRWSLEQGLSYSPTWEEEDKVCGLSDDQRTMREFQKMANSQLDFIRVTYDTCTDHESGKLPILDLQCWFEA